MIVVADTSPFIALVNIDLVDILPSLFGGVLIPQAVARELASPARSEKVRNFIQQTPPWLSIRSAANVPVTDLHAGETEAINLALELSADLLLIDESAGRTAAVARNITTVRTVAVIAEAANMGLAPDLGAAFEKLARTNFRVPPRALDELLKQHNKNRLRNR